MDGELNKDEVDKRTDASMVVPLLQAIFTMLLVSGKSLHELPLLLTRLSESSQTSLPSHPQPSLFPSSSCSCNTQTRACCEATAAFVVKVSRLVNKFSNCAAWFKQLCRAQLCDVYYRYVLTLNLIV